MSFFGKSNKNHEGLLEFFKLSEWYENLPKETQDKICLYYASGGKNPDDLSRGKVKASSNASGFLWPIGFNAILKSDYATAKILLNKSLELTNEATSKHFSLLGMIDLLYRQRKEQPDAIEECIYYCQEDIELAPEFIQEFKEDCVALDILNKNGSLIDDFYMSQKEKGESDSSILKKRGVDIATKARELSVRLPFIPSFTKLALIYESKGMYQEAIDICQMAKLMGLVDNGKKDYSERIEKLLKKKDKMSPSS